MCSLVQIASAPRSDEETVAKAASRARRASESDTMCEVVTDKNVDILQMLSKAQDEYDKVCLCAYVIICAVLIIIVHFFINLIILHFLMLVFGLFSSSYQNLIM